MASRDEEGEVETSRKGAEKKQSLMSEVQVYNTRADPK